jgi:hypothetical protein
MPQQRNGMALVQQHRPGLVAGAARCRRRAGSPEFLGVGTNGEGEEGEEMAESIWDGEMPLPVFLITHPEARLTDAELDQLAQGLLATGGAEGEGGEPDERGDTHQEDDDEHEENEDDD